MGLGLLGNRTAAIEIASVSPKEIISPLFGLFFFLEKIVFHEISLFPAQQGTIISVLHINKYMLLRNHTFLDISLLRLSHVNV